jgi:hypothetical protein
MYIQIELRRIIENLVEAIDSDGWIANCNANLRNIP